MMYIIYETNKQKYCINDLVMEIEAWLLNIIQFDGLYHYTIAAPLLLER